ncbi:MAG: GAF domain-containing protein, partial [Nitrospinae bacterium]|nr:GAF domain-containing protein [Nitrospinota bacterium]
MADGGRELDIVYRLSRLLAGGTDCPSLLRAILREALALTGSSGGRVLLLERERRTLRSFVEEGQGPAEGAEVPAEDPPWGEAIREGRAVCTPLTADTNGHDSMSAVATLVLPLLARGDVLGVLVLQGLPEKWARAPHGVFLEILGNLAAHALHNAAYSRDLSRRKEELSTLIEVGQDIAASLDLDEVLRRVVRQATRLMRAKVCSLMLIDEVEQTLRIRATYGASRTYTQRPPLDIHVSLIGEVVRAATPIAVLDVRQDPQYQFVEMARAERLCSLLCVPLKT